jgi:hypothetical protein
VSRSTGGHSKARRLSGEGRRAFLFPPASLQFHNQDEDQVQVARILDTGMTSVLDSF